MLYSKQITIPANTTEAKLITTDIKVNKGIIYYVWVTLPPGCNDMVKFRILNDTHPFLPVNKDSYIAGNNYTYQFPAHEPIKDMPGILTIETWSPGTTYQHTIGFQILIVPEGIVYPSVQIAKAIEDLTKMYR